jgi:short-subunit dehydrogenase
VREVGAAGGGRGVNLGGQTALVTGASGGLGQAIARALARRGARLVVSARRVEVLEPLAAETGGRALACDLADRLALERLVADAGAVDVLVANAGVPGSGRIESFTVEEIDRALDVNLRAPMVLARLMCEGMADRGGGQIVFVSSLSGKAATAGSSVYAATKFGLRGFAQGLREDLRPRGVGVSTVFPGFIRDVGMFHDSRAKLPPYVGTKTPEDVARAVVSAIEHDRSEIDVAPLPLRLGTAFAALAPEAAAMIQRRLGAGELARQFEDGQRDKR